MWLQSHDALQDMHIRRNNGTLEHSPSHKLPQSSPAHAATEPRPCGNKGTSNTLVQPKTPHLPICPTAFLHSSIEPFLNRIAFRPQPRRTNGPEQPIAMHDALQNHQPPGTDARRQTRDPSQCHQLVTSAPSGQTPTTGQALPAPSSHERHQQVFRIQQRPHKHVKLGDVVVPARVHRPRPH